MEGKKTYYRKFNAKGSNPEPLTMNVAQSESSGSLFTMPSQSNVSEANPEPLVLRTVWLHYA